jgi:hypothetical protein
MMPVVDVGQARELANVRPSGFAVTAVLRSATEAAYERGVIGVPTIAVDEHLFWGDDRLEDAAAAPEACRSRRLSGATAAVRRSRTNSP